MTGQAPHVEQISFDKKRGRFTLPRVLLKVCVHNGGEGLERRFRGDMIFDIETYAGRREDVYKCLACGKTKSAEALWQLYQAYIVLGFEVVV